MAFNPFDFFRRYQKFFFAVLAIVCMFVFILSFGAGDFFTWAQARFNGPRESGEKVATLYGKPVVESQINRTQFHRQIASEFLFTTLFTQRGKVEREVPNQFGGAFVFPSAAEGVAKLDKTVKGGLGDVANAIVDRIIQRSARFSQISTAEEQSDMDFAVRMDLDMLRNAMLFDRNAEGKTVYSTLDASQRGPLDDLLLYLQYERYRVAPGSNFSDLVRGHLAPMRDFNGQIRLGLQVPGVNKSYFLGGTRTTEDLLDFMVWKNQANKLGIHPTDSAVLRLALTYTGMKSIPQKVASFEDNALVQEFLGARSARERITAEDLLEALRDEVRVQLAREAMTGRPVEGTFPALGLYLTPVTVGAPAAGEAYEHFVKQATTINASLLEVPVDAFLEKVTGQPDEKDLQAMFDKYKNQEPSPELSRPAFKEPRRAKVQYLHLSGTSSFIQEQADRARTLGEAIMPLGVALGAGLGHGSLSSSAFAVPVAITAMHPDSVLAEAYEAYRNGRANSLDSWLNTEADFGVQYGPHDTSWMRVGAAGPLMGYLMASFHNGTASPIPALSAWGYTIREYEEGARSWYQRKLSPGVILSVDPNTALVGGLALGLFQKENGSIAETVPLKTIAGLFRSYQVESLVERIRSGLMLEAYDVVKSLRGKTEKEATPILEKFLKDRGIESSLHTTPYAMDNYELAKDPAMKDLIRVCERLTSIDPTGRMATEFAVRELALRNRGIYEPIRWGPTFGGLMQNAQRMSPQQAEEFAGEEVLKRPDAVIIWRTEDRDALVPANLDTFVWDRDKRVKVREKVQAAWKREAAQYLAEDHLRKLRDRLKQANLSVDATLQELREQKPGLIKELYGIGRMVKVATPTQSSDVSYRPGEIPSSVVAQPRPEMINQMLNGLKAKGDMLVVSDRPVRNWYLVLCQERVEPTVNTYLEARRSTKTLTFQGPTDQLPQRIPFPNGFYTVHTVPAEEKVYEEKLMARMRKEACKEADRLDATGKWTLPPSLRVNFERTSDAGDF